ncbi:MAG TPA: hypothetical protein DCO89_02320 [Clostridiales bacterium]|nr:hypothetical protein [Clostridiales bacterium]
MENKELNLNTPSLLTESKFKNSKIVLANQNQLSLTGVSKVIQSTETVISVILSGQNVDITGTKLTVNKLDVENGILEANGVITEIKFAEKKQKENIFKRIFK